MGGKAEKTILEPMYLLDTNIVIYYLKAALPPKAMQLLNTIVDEQLILSVITKIELLVFAAPNKEEQDITTFFIQEADILNLDEEIVAQTIAIRKQYKTKLPDAIIAATAIVHNLTLLTRNTADFAKIPNLLLIDPYLL